MTQLAQPLPDTKTPLRAALAHGPHQADNLDLRPSLQKTLTPGRRALITGVAALVGATVGTIAAPAAATTLVLATIGVAIVTAVAANWSTCGMSVVGVVAAPKQPERVGASTPVRRLGWHALGSVLTGAPTGALLGLVGMLAASALPLHWTVAAWATVAVLYGMHELGLFAMPTPMRRRQLPRHLRRTMQPRKVAFLFGTMIGPGFVIFIRSSAYYLLVLGVVAVGSQRSGRDSSSSCRSAAACRACSRSSTSARGARSPDSCRP